MVNQKQILSKNIALKIAEADATERYQPYLDWKGNTPVPLEGKKVQETIDNPTTEDEAQKALETDKAIDLPEIDPALMQEAIDKLMEQDK